MKDCTLTNIHPKEEFDKRKNSVLAMSEDYGVPVTINELNLLDWRTPCSRTSLSAVLTVMR